MTPALQKYVHNPNDIDGLLNNIESQAKTIYTS
jgi:hypothetical protein